MGFTDLWTHEGREQWEALMLERLEGHVFDEKDLAEAMIHGWMVVLGNANGEIPADAPPGFAHMAEVAAEVAFRWAYRNDLQP